MVKKNIYLAGSLFSLAEREFNINLSTHLNKYLDNFEIILPQMFAKSIDGNANMISKIFSYCIEMIKNTDLVVAILDGSDADSGTCIELGYAYGLNKPILGIRTDLRNSEDRGVNLMVSNVCNEFIWDVLLTDTESLAKLIATKIKENKW